MLRKICSGFAILILLCNTFAFAHTATIENSGTKKYKAVRLTPEIYNYAKENLADLVLYDQNNEPIPYFINRFTESSELIQQSYDMMLINSFVKDDWFYFDYLLQNAAAPKKNQDILATAIVVETKNQNFAKEMQLLGSYDNINWESIKEDTLYRVEGKQKLDISFDKPLKYTYYRFKLANNLEKISFDSVKLDYNNMAKNKEYFTETITPKFTVAQSDKNTIISIEGLKNMEIGEITIDSSSMFQRLVSYANGKSKTLYHLLFGQTKYQDMSLPFDGYRSTGDTLEITIYNHDDKPIVVDNLAVTYLTHEVVFEGREGGYRLSFGNADVSALSYDIVNYKELIIKEGYDMLSVSNVVIDNQKAEGKTYDYKMIFNILIVIVTILLGFVMVRKLKKK